MELSKEEIFNRVKTFLENYNDWVPTTFAGLGASIGIKSLLEHAQNYGLTDPSLQSAIALYMGNIFNDNDLIKKLNEHSKSLPRVLQFTPKNTLINQIKKQKEKIIQLQIYLPMLLNILLKM